MGLKCVYSLENTLLAIFGRLYCKN